MRNWFLHSGLVYRNSSLKAESVLILNGKIAAFGAEANEMRETFGGPITDFDVSDSVVSRGLVDLHVHLREPGFETKETILTGTKAAAAGGFTAVCPMPNTDPCLDSRERLIDLNNRIGEDAQVKVYPIAALTKGRLGIEILNYDNFAKNGIRLFSDDGDPLAEQIAEKVFLAIKEVDGVLINHLEDKSLIQEGFFCGQIPSESEYLMLKRDLNLVEETKCSYHAAHLSCVESVELIAEAKVRGLPVTAEVTPHHLTLTHEDIIEPKGNFQMKPPLRSEADRKALVEGLKTGVIDMVATDHAPHGNEKDRGLFPGSPFGVTALETAFPVLYTYLVLSGQLSLERLLEGLTKAPAQLLNVQGELTIGEDADLAVFNLKQEKKVIKEAFYSKGTNSPYLGHNLKGWTSLTLVRGEEKFRMEEMGNGNSGK